MLDVGKGLAAVLWVPVLVLPGCGLGSGRIPSMAGAGLAVLPSFWGMSTLCGSAFAAARRGNHGRRDRRTGARLLVPLFSCWFIVVLLTGYVGLASMLGRAGLVIAVACSSRPTRRSCSFASWSLPW